MSFEIEGKLHKIFDTESKTETFQAREFVIVTDGVYPQYVKFQLTQDRCSIIDAYSEEEKVKVFFDLRGREWNGKYFTNLNAWKIEKPVEVVESPSPVDQTANKSSDDPFDFPAEEPKTLENDYDDLPF